MTHRELERITRAMLDPMTEESELRAYIRRLAREVALQERITLSVRGPREGAEAN